MADKAPYHTTPKGIDHFNRICDEVRAYTPKPKDEPKPKPKPPAPKYSDAYEDPTWRREES